MDIQGLAENVARFIGHYAGELRTVASTVETVIGALPLDPGDKERLNGVLAALQDAATRAADGAAALSQATVEVVVSASDVEAAVAAYLTAHPDVISGAAGNANAEGSTGA